MNTSSSLRIFGEETSNWEFLGGLIDPRDVKEGPFKLYTDMRDYQAFTLHKERVGFPGCIGLREQNLFDTDRESLEFNLWERTPPRDTKHGYIDVFERRPNVKIVWTIVKETQMGSPTKNPLPKLQSVVISMEPTNVHSPVLDYSLKIISKARELWPKEK
jgi:hypothetical protein